VKAGVFVQHLCNLHYGFDAAVKAFEALEPQAAFHTILDYDVMVDSALRTGYVDSDEARLLSQWREDPFGWGEKHGFSQVVK
jgi:orotate phosphoribosyltransferase